MWKHSTGPVKILGSVSLLKSKPSCNGFFLDTKQQVKTTFQIYIDNNNNLVTPCSVQNTYTLFIHISHTCAVYIIKSPSKFTQIFLITSMMGSAAALLSYHVLCFVDIMLPTSWHPEGPATATCLTTTNSTPPTHKHKDRVITFDQVQTDCHTLYYCSSHTPWIQTA